MAEVTAFREIDVMVQGRCRVLAFRDVGHQQIVGAREAKRIRGGGEERHQRLLKIITRAVPREELRGPGFELFPVDCVAAKTADAYINASGHRPPGELGKGGRWVTVGVVDIEHVYGAVRCCEPREERVGATEKQHVGVEDETVAVIAGVDIGELAQMNVGEALGTERWETECGESGVEECFNFSGALHAGARKEAVCFGDESVVERPVIDEHGAERTCVAGERVDAEGALIPEAFSGQDKNFRSKRRSAREWGKGLCGSDHCAAAAGVEPLLPRTAFAAATGTPRERAKVGEVKDASQREGRNGHEREGNWGAG